MGAKKKLRIISTPSGHGNLFHKLWSDAEARGFRAHKVTIHEAVAQGLPLNVDQLKSGLVHPEAWAQEYECQFIDQTSVLLPYALIEQCESPDATETAFDLSRATGEIFVGIDFGRKHDLTACWILERLGQELWTRELLTLERMSTPQQAEILLPRLQRARRVCLDYTGSGVGLGDLLTAQLGTAPHGRVELCNFTTGLKDELFPKLRAALEARKYLAPAQPGHSRRSAFDAPRRFRLRKNLLSRHAYPPMAIAIAAPHWPSRSVRPKAHQLWPRLYPLAAETRFFLDDNALRTFTKRFSHLSVLPSRS